MGEETLELPYESVYPFMPSTQLSLRNIQFGVEMDPPIVSPATGRTMNPADTSTPIPDVVRVYSLVKSVNPVWKRAGLPAASVIEVYSLSQMLCRVTLIPKKKMLSTLPDALRTTSWTYPVFSLR